MLLMSDGLILACKCDSRMILKVEFKTLTLHTFSSIIDSYVSDKGITVHVIHIQGHIILRPGSVQR